MGEGFLEDFEVGCEQWVGGCIADTMKMLQKGSPAWLPCAEASRVQTEHGFALHSKNYI